MFMEVIKVNEYKEIERSIIKKYRKEIFSKFIKAINEFKLIEENDRVAVCISGGKDSMLLAKCLEELKRHGKIKFDLKFIVMDPGYNKENMEQIKLNLDKLKIDAHIFKTDIFKIAGAETNNINIKKDNACYLCARMRRGNLYNKAKELGCNKIALGHHFDDVVETVLMNLIYTGQYSSMLPKLKSDNFENMELIRPLYYVKEHDIISWKTYNNLTFIDCACNVTKKGTSKRSVMKNLATELENLYVDAKVNIMTSTKNINIDTVIAYKKDGKTTNYLDNY